MLQVFTTEPRKILLLDAFGALISGIFLGFVLPLLEDFFGFPAGVCYFLAAFPFFFLVFDLVCFFYNKIQVYFALKAISILNILYCDVSLVSTLYHFEQILLLGWFYMLGEISVILILARFEWKMSKPNPS